MIKKLALTAAILSSLAMSTGANAVALPTVAPGTDLMTYWSGIKATWQSYVGQSTSGTWTDAVKTSDWGGGTYIELVSSYNWNLTIGSKVASGVETLTKTVSTLYVSGSAYGAPDVQTPGSQHATVSYSVPGPVAGAGLPLLLVLGGAAFALRRKGAIAA